jgi:hypothetical protein
VNNLELSFRFTKKAIDAALTEYGRAIEAGEEPRADAASTVVAWLSHVYNGIRRDSARS